MPKRRRGEKKITYFDYNLLFIIIFLLCFGLVMLYSSSSYTSANKYGDSAHYLKLQARNIAIGLVFMFYFAKKDYHVWRKFGRLAYWGALGFCLVVLAKVPGLTRSSHGQSRWIQVGPIGFQPSELAKIAIIIYLAMLIERIPKQLDKVSSMAKVGIRLVPLVLFVAVNNLSTAIIILGIAVCMLFVASPKYKEFFVVAVLGVLFIFAFINIASYRSDRVEAWKHPETAGDKGYQTMQALYAIGSGKLFGKGLGQSLQKLGNVPEAQNDMIFSIICEELGLVGAGILLLLFLVLIWRFFLVSVHAPDLLGSLIAAGVMGHISIQVILNVAVVTNTIPNTGITLPFVSYGGTSILFLLAEMGLVLGISRKC